MLTGVISSGVGKLPANFTNVEFVLFTNLTSTNPSIFVTPYVPSEEFFEIVKVIFLSSKFFLSSESLSSHDSVICRSLTDASFGQLPPTVTFLLDGFRDISIVLLGFNLSVGTLIDISMEATRQFPGKVQFPFESDVYITEIKVTKINVTFSILERDT